MIICDLIYLDSVFEFVHYFIDYNQVEVKFVWQISVRPCNCCSFGKCFGGYLHDFGQIVGLPISAKWANLEIVYKFPVQNAN